jgi:hypothetical protein
MNRLSTATLTVLMLLVLTLLPVRVLAQAHENVDTGTAAIEPSDRIQDCSSGGNTCSTTYPQIYCSADGETHFRDVSVPLTLIATNSDPNFRSTINPENASLWVVFPKGWGVDEFRQGIFHLYAGPKRFVSIREGTITVRVTDGEERTFKKGDIFEAVDLAPCKGRLSSPCKGRLSKSEDGAVALLTNHP